MTHTNDAALPRVPAFFLPSQGFMRTAPLLTQQASAFDEKCPRRQRAHLKLISIESAGELPSLSLSEDCATATSVPPHDRSHAKYFNSQASYAVS
jgi:hypothetical protein